MEHLPRNTAFLFRGLAAGLVVALAGGHQGLLPRPRKF
jgi:hypothetical protein